MGEWVADRLHERLGNKASRVLVLGLTFKENVPDLRNSRVIDVVRRLQWLGHEVLVADPLADPAEAAHEYGLELVDPATLGEKVDLVLGAVAHAEYKGWSDVQVSDLLKGNGQVADLKRLWTRKQGSTGSAWTL
jgi:UDP-N-acetyl-D-galactosamine dehydrogenase